ncbi:MAG: hypothetical protein OXF02_08100 [Simkaniaceae bacterium]|nr:hypothetical protein [Simkaniaceae bacterium]
MPVRVDLASRSDNNTTRFLSSRLSGVAQRSFRVAFPILVAFGGRWGAGIAGAVAGFVGASMWFPWRSQQRVCSRDSPMPGDKPFVDDLPYKPYRGDSPDPEPYAALANTRRSGSAYGSDEIGSGPSPSYDSEDDM